MDTIIARIMKLIDLAIDDRTPIEEARTAGVTACQMIARHKLTLTDPAKAVEASGIDLGSFFHEVEIVESVRRWPDAGPTPRGRPAKPKREREGDRVVTAQSAGFCALCGDAYTKGERVIFMAERREIAHGTCFRGRGRRPDLS